MTRPIFHTSHTRLPYPPASSENCSKSAINFSIKIRSALIPSSIHLVGGKKGLVLGHRLTHAAHDMKQMGRVLQLPCMGARLSHVFGPLHILNAPTVHLEYFPRGEERARFCTRVEHQSSSTRFCTRVEHSELPIE